MTGNRPKGGGERRNVNMTLLKMGEKHVPEEKRRDCFVREDRRRRAEREEIRRKRKKTKKRQIRGVRDGNKTESKELTKAARGKR